MRGPDVRDLLGRLEEAPAPEPSALFVAKLEADLRSMGHTSEAHASPARPRSRRVRVLIAAGPVAALAAAAAAAAVTLLPSKPHPNEVKTADPGVTATTAPTEAPPSSVPTPTTVAPPPWLPPAAAPSPVTTVPRSSATTTPAPSPAEHSTPAVVGPRERVTTTVPRVTTTTVPSSEAMTLRCTPGTSAGSPVIFCGWSQAAAPSFKWYRLWRQSAGSPPAVVFQSDNRPTTGYYDHAVQAGTNYYYKIDIADAAGNVIGTSPVTPVTCC